MKQMKRFFLVLFVAMTATVLTSSAQLIIKVRPERPHYVRVEAPSPRHVWVDEEWEWHDGGYVWAGGRWVEPERPGARWVPGRWRERPGGWIWVRGHWRY